MKADWGEAFFTGFLMIFFVMGLMYGMKTLFVIIPLVLIVGALILRNKLDRDSFFTVVAVVLFLFALVGFGACVRALTSSSRYSSYESVDGWLLTGFVLTAIALGCFVYAGVNTWKIKKKQEAEWKAEEEQREREKEARERNIRERYGEESERFEGGDLIVRVFRKAQAVVINDHPYDFNRLIGCYIREHTNIVPGYSNTEYSVKPRTSSMVKGALIGGLTGNWKWGYARALGDMEIERQTTTVPDTYNTLYTATVAVYDENEKDNTREYTYTTGSLRRAEKLEALVHRIMFEYDPLE